MVGVVACGDPNSVAEQPEQDGADSFAGVDSLAEAEVAAKQVVDDTVARYLADRPARDDGLEEHPCDPLEDGQELYDYVMAVDVPADEVEAVTTEIWQYWQEVYGFKLQSENHGNEPPVVLAEVDGFRGSLTCDSSKEVVYVGVSSPCFPGDG